MSYKSMPYHSLFLVQWSLGVSRSRSSFFSGMHLLSFANSHFVSHGLAGSSCWRPILPYLRLLLVRFSSENILLYFRPCLKYDNELASLQDKSKLFKTSGAKSVRVVQWPLVVLDFHKSSLCLILYLVGTKSKINPLRSYLKTYKQRWRCSALLRFKDFQSIKGHSGWCMKRKI